MTIRQEEIPRNNNQVTNKLQLFNIQTFVICKLIIDNCLVIGIRLLVIKTKAKPVINSINGYCQLNFFPQHLVFPFKTKNEITGNISCQAIFFPQKSQWDLPLILSSLGKRSIKTLRNDPIEAPKIKIVKFTNNSIILSIANYILMSRILFNL